MGVWQDVQAKGKQIFTDPGEALKFGANPGNVAISEGAKAAGYNGPSKEDLGLGRYQMDPYQINEKPFQQSSYDQALKNTFSNQLAISNGRQDPTMQGATIDPSQQAQFRQQQMALAQQLSEQAAGRGPSLSNMQMQQTTDRGMAQAQSLAASQRGLSAGQRARLAGNQMSNITSSAAQAAAQGRVQEQMNAQNSLAGVLGQGRGQDLGLATSQAQLTQGASQQNLAAALANQAQKNQMAQFYNQGLVGMNNQSNMNAMELERLKANQYLGAHQINSGGFAAQQQAQGNMIAGLGSAAVAASDENLKTDIAPADAKLGKFLEALSASEYRYKDEKFGKGKFVSPMAQEMEKSEIGKSMVIDTPKGKMVDYARGAGTYLSAAAMLNRRLDGIEKKFAQALSAKGA